MKHLGGGNISRIAFHDYFISRWDQWIIAIYDYAYAGLDFRGDLDLSLPPTARWGDIGKYFFIL